MTELVLRKDNNEFVLFEYHTNELSDLLIGSFSKYPKNMILLDIYIHDKATYPKRLILEMRVNKDLKICECFSYDYDFDKLKEFTELYEGYELVLTNIEYKCSMNRWLLSEKYLENKYIMEIDDEMETYDGQYISHFRLFENNRLTKIKRQYNSILGINYELEKFI